MLFKTLLLAGITILGSYAAVNDCNILKDIFTEYNLEVYWKLDSNECCRDSEYPVLIECNQNSQITKIHIENLYLEKYSISEKFCNFNALISLELINNGFKGNIPSCITSVTSLEYLNLSSNALTGTIPESIENLKNLKELQLSKNQLTGEFPEALGNIGSITDIHIDSNQLSGSLPHSLDNLLSIKSFDISNNQFSGELPEEFYNMYTLEHVYINNNAFTGQLDSDIGVFSSLLELDFTNNKFEGKIPSNISKLQNLEWLSLAGNKFTGDFPTRISKIQYLGYLDISNNNFSSIPTSIENLNYLGYIDISKNKNLSGELRLGKEVETCIMDSGICVKGGACKNKVNKCSGNVSQAVANDISENLNNLSNQDTAGNAIDTVDTTSGGNTDVSEEDKCWASIYGYPCCEGETKNNVYANDINGQWGFDFTTSTWCGIAPNKETVNSYNKKNGDNDECWSLELGYYCCVGCYVQSVTEEGSWGVEHNQWCGIPYYCNTQ